MLSDGGVKGESGLENSALMTGVLLKRTKKLGFDNHFIQVFPDSGITNIYSCFQSNSKCYANWSGWVLE